MGVRRGGVGDCGDQIQGTLTAGTGHTNGLTIGFAVTAEMDAAWLIADLGTAGGRLAVQIGSVVDELTDNQYGALLDFVFNLGANPAWTIWKRLKAKQFDAIPSEMQRFVNANGKKLQGLVNRRNAECALWAKDEPGTVADPVPSSVTRASPTPPTPSPALARGKALIAGGVGAAAGVGPVVHQVMQAIEPYTQHSQYVEKALGVLAVIAALSASAGIFYMVLQTQNARN